MILTAILSLGLSVDAPEPLLLGPPAICQPFAIGDAPSLPWDVGAFGIDPDYDLDRLVRQTRRLLDAEEEVLVRMETIRRAVIYASGVGDHDRDDRPTLEARRTIVAELVSMLRERALAPHLATEPAGDSATAPPLFDLGFALAGLRQLEGVGGLARLDSDGEAELRKAIAWSQAPAAMHLGVSLGLFLSREKGLSDGHLLLAAKGSVEGTLLRENVMRCAARFHGT
ncbi:MAG: hypothetical protein ACYTF3_04040, partial [Planctomycetota bacterium]